jgi:hypothetical protein
VQAWHARHARNPLVAASVVSDITGQRRRALDACSAARRGHRPSRDISQAEFGTMAAHNRVGLAFVMATLLLYAAAAVL